MSATSNLEKSFLFASGRFKQPAAQAAWNERIRRAVTHEHRSAVLMNLGQRIVAILHQPPDWHEPIKESGCVGHRRRRILKNQSAGAVLGRQVDDYGAAERSAHEDDIRRLFSGALGKPELRRMTVGQNPRLSRRTFALTVAAI